MKLKGFTMGLDSFPTKLKGFTMKLKGFAMGLDSFAMGLEGFTGRVVQSFAYDNIFLNTILNNKQTALTLKNSFN